jgi:hypothetical protein
LKRDRPGIYPIRTVLVPIFPSQKADQGNTGPFLLRVRRVHISASGLLHSENNGVVLPVGSPELKLEMATAIGLNCQRSPGEHTALGNLAERKGFSSTDLPDARNPINKRAFHDRKQRCVPPVCTTLGGLRQVRYDFPTKLRPSIQFLSATFPLSEGTITQDPARHP